MFKYLGFVFSFGLILVFATEVSRAVEKQIPDYSIIKPTKNENYVAPPKASKRKKNSSNNTVEKPIMDVAEPVAPTMEQKLIKRNIEISEWFDGIADSIDVFLVGKKVTRDINETRVVLENTTYSFEHKAIKTNLSLGIFPRFPNLEKYWALKFTTYDEKEDRRDVKNNYITTNQRRQNYGATVAWYRKFGAIRTSFEPRLELQDPLRISHSLNFDSIANFEKYELHPKLELYASARRGPGFFQSFNISYFINRHYTLTMINEGDYLDKSRTYTTNNGFSLGNSLTKKSTLTYGVIVTSLNRPVYRMNSYATSVSYNEMVYKKIFDYTITPYIQFVRALNYKGEVGAVLNLKLQF